MRQWNSLLSFNRLFFGLVFRSPYSEKRPVSSTSIHTRSSLWLLAMHLWIPFVLFMRNSTELARRILLYACVGTTYVLAIQTGRKIHRIHFLPIAINLVPRLGCCMRAQYLPWRKEAHAKGFECYQCPFKSIHEQIALPVKFRPKGLTSMTKVGCTSHSPFKRCIPGMRFPFNLNSTNQLPGPITINRGQILCSRLCAQAPRKDRHIRLNWRL